MYLTRGSPLYHISRFNINIIKDVANRNFNNNVSLRPKNKQTCYEIN